MANSYAQTAEGRRCRRLETGTEHTLYAARWLTGVCQPFETHLSLDTRELQRRTEQCHPVIAQMTLASPECLNKLV